MFTCLLFHLRCRFPLSRCGDSTCRRTLHTMPLLRTDAICHLFLLTTCPAGPFHLPTGKGGRAIRSVLFLLLRVPCLVCLFCELVVSNDSYRKVGKHYVSVSFSANNGFPTHTVTDKVHKIVAVCLPIRRPSGRTKLPHSHFVKGR